METELAQAIDALMFHKFALLLAVSASLYLWWWAKECRCEKCAFHANERRMEAARRKDREHDAQHRGYNYLTGKWDSDQYNCEDSHCSRNKERGLD